MERHILSILIAVSLLLCPLRCLSNECATGIKGPDVEKNCCCCPTEKDCDDVPLGKEFPNNDSSCPDCICEGAMLQCGSKSSINSIEAAATHCLFPREVADPCVAKSEPAGARNRPLHFGEGRGLLIAFQVWQI